MTTRGGDEKCSRSKMVEKRHQRVALCFSTAVCTSNGSLNNLSLILFFPFFTSARFLSLHLMSEGANFEYSTRRRQVSEKRKKRTNEPASFCLYSSYSRRTIVYIFFFPQRSNRSSVNEQHCVFVHLFVQFVS
jgi:hypothetical protein